MPHHRSKQIYLMTTLAFALAIVAGVFGLARCFVQSPQARAANYLAVSLQTIGENPLVAASAAWEAARIHPTSPQAWDMLARTLEQNGNDLAAVQAHKIAARLHAAPDRDLQPLYAMPAELRLSLLSLSGGGL